LCWKLWQNLQSKKIHEALSTQVVSMILKKRTLTELHWLGLVVSVVRRTLVCWQIG
jgi:hypothetical protein